MAPADTGREDFEEKRRHQRYANERLGVDVSRPGIKGIIRTNPTAECMNFSLTGLQFDCPEALDPGEKILIDIAVDDLEIRDLEAEVVSRQSLPGDHFCHGVRFCLESPEMKKAEIHRCLLQIEDKLKLMQEYPE